MWPLLASVIMLAAAETASPTPSAAVATAAPSLSPAAVKARHASRTEFLAVQRGKIDRSHYTARAAAQLTDDLIAKVGAQLTPLGGVKTIELLRNATAQDLDVYEFVLTCETGVVIETIAFDAAGKIAGLRFRPAE